MHLALLQEKADAEVTCISAVSTFLGEGWAPQAASKVGLEWAVTVPLGLCLHEVLCWPEHAATWHAQTLKMRAV